MSRDKDTGSSGTEYRRLTVGEALVMWPMLTGIVVGTAFFTPSLPMDWILPLAVVTAVLVGLWCLKGLTVGTRMPLPEHSDPDVEFRRQMERAYGPDWNADGRRDHLL